METRIGHNLIQNHSPALSLVNNDKYEPYFLWFGIVITGILLVESVFAIRYYYIHCKRTNDQIAKEQTKTS